MLVIVYSLLLRVFLIVLFMFLRECAMDTFDCSDIDNSLTSNGNDIVVFFLFVILDDMLAKWFDCVELGYTTNVTNITMVYVTVPYTILFSNAYDGN